MKTLERIVDWIDRGYADDARRSNYAMGAILSIVGLLALSLDNLVMSAVLITFAAVVFLLFGWRMIRSFGRIERSSDRRQKRRP